MTNKRKKELDEVYDKIHISSYIIVSDSKISCGIGEVESLNGLYSHIIRGFWIDDVIEIEYLFKKVFKYLVKTDEEFAFYMFSTNHEYPGLIKVMDNITKSIHNGVMTTSYKNPNTDNKIKIWILPVSEIRKMKL